MMKTHMAEAFMLPYTLLSGTLRRAYGYGNDYVLRSHAL